MTDRPPRPRYTDDEAAEILKRALERQHADDDKTAHDDLLEAAREVGIDPDHFDHAAGEVVQERDRSSTSIAPAARDAVATYRRDQRQSFVYFTAITIALVGALAGVDSLTGGGWWFQWPALVGAVLVAIRAARLLRPDADIRRDLEKRDRREKKARERKEREEQRRRAKRAKAEERASEREERRQRKRDAWRDRADRKGKSRDRSRDFERTVEEGVHALFAEHARRMRRAAERALDPKSKDSFARAAERANAQIASTVNDANDHIQDALGANRPRKQADPRVRVEAPDDERRQAGDDDEREIDAEVDDRTRRSRRDDPS